MGPVFLFDVSVVVFVIGPASGELNGFFPLGKVSQEVLVKELPTVIAIEAEDGERKGFFEVPDVFQNPCFALSPDGALFCPAGGDIDKVDGVDVHSFCGITAMSDRIGFEKTWT